MDIAHLLNDTISIARKDGTLNKFGEKGYGLAFDVSARVEQRSEILRDSDGTEYRTTHWILTNQAIRWDDLISIEGEVVKRKPKIIERAETGDASCVVYEVKL